MSPGHLYKMHVLPAENQFVLDASGQLVELSGELREQIVQSYNRDLHEAPLILGHSSDPYLGVPQSDTEPAYGWIRSVYQDADGVWCVVEATDQGHQLIQSGAYDKRSVAYYDPSSPVCPTPGTAYLRHLALLGAQPPAIKGLQPAQLIQLEENQMPTEEEQILEPADAGMPADAEMPADTSGFEGEISPENTAEVLRYLLTADAEGYAGEITAFDPEPSPDNNYLWDEQKEAFSGKFIDESLGEPQVFEFEIERNGEEWVRSFIPVSGVEEIVEPEFAEKLRRENRQLRKQLARHEYQQIKQFSETFYTDGLITEAEIPQTELIALLAFCEGKKNLLQFAESPAKTKPGSVLRKLLSRLQPAVTFGETVMGNPEPRSRVRLPAGAVVSPEGAEQDKRIRKYCEANGLNPDKPTDYRKAMRAVSNK